MKKFQKNLLMKHLIDIVINLASSTDAEHSLDNQKEISANNVICNADPPAVYENLLIKKKFGSIYFYRA